MVKTIEDVKGKIFCICTACMSVWSDFLSWANANPDRMVTFPSHADSIVVLSCQVTDLAILNDISTMKFLMETYPGKDYYIGGCLAQRLDVDLPETVLRLDHTRSDKTPIENKHLVTFATPFWVKNFDASSDDNEGMLFRSMYPLRIGVGCAGKCIYCTIKHTRGKPYQIPAIEIEQEFLNHTDVVLICDSPTKEQLLDWIKIALWHRKPISIRNAEPTVVMEIFSSLMLLSARGLLKILHCPVQSGDEEILNYMKRDAKQTLEFINFGAPTLRKLGTKIATNIIIDIPGYPNSSLDLQMQKLGNVFDYLVWNPMWKGKYDEALAIARFDKYILGESKSMKKICSVIFCNDMPHFVVIGFMSAVIAKMEELKLAHIDLLIQQEGRKNFDIDAYARTFHWHTHEVEYTNAEV